MTDDERKIMREVLDEARSATGRNLRFRDLLEICSSEPIAVANARQGELAVPVRYGWWVVLPAE